jgi:hypothetical protein
MWFVSCLMSRVSCFVPRMVATKHTKGTKPDIFCTAAGAEHAEVFGSRVSCLVSPCHRVTVSPCLRVSVSPCLRVSVSPCLRVSGSPVPMSPSLYNAF